MINEDYLPMALREFKRLKALAEKALVQVPADRFFEVTGAEDNSLAVVVKHVAGNLRSRWRDFLTADGEKPGRNRDAEFVIGPEDTRERLMAAWEDGWGLLFGALSPLKGADLSRTVLIRGEPLSVLQVVNRQLTHYAYHVGQIVFLAKHFAGSKWTSLSIPRGQSEAFNQAPKKYLGKL